MKNKQRIMVGANDACRFLIEKEINYFLPIYVIVCCIQ
jgi:hypothetical protein